MDKHLEEEEIKIEYNESFETDPLCEKIDANSNSNYDVPAEHISLDTQESVDQAGYNDSPIFSSHPSSTCDLELEDLDCNFPETRATWYKEIDKSGKYVCKFCDLTYSTTQTVRHHVKTKHPENANSLKNLIKNNKRNRKMKCHICKQRFKLLANLKEHMKEHSENLLRSCQVCLATFNNNEETIQHLYHKHQNIPETKTYSCLTCGYRTRKLSHFRQHKNTHSLDKKLKCDFCEYSTNYSPNLKIHVRIHKNYKPYACEYNDCGYRCAAKSALRSHQLKHFPEENMLYCDRCTYKTVYRQSLKNFPETRATWYKEIDKSGKYVCKFCDLTYSTTQTVRHHVKTKHPENANSLKNLIKNNKRNRKMKCHICKQRFKLLANLKEHMKEHSENLLRSCQVCLATFNNNEETIQHLYHKHQNIPETKTYSCLTCGYRTRKLSHFRQHKNTHSLDKKLKCDFCEYSTNYSPNLKIHVRIHKNYKPYACEYNDCGYRCAAKSALRSHQLKHFPEENMLYCDRCTYKTVYRQSLKVHIECHDRNGLKVPS